MNFTRLLFIRDLPVEIWEETPIFKKLNTLLGLLRSGTTYLCCRSRVFSSPSNATKKDMFLQTYLQSDPAATKHIEGAVRG